MREHSKNATGQRCYYIIACLVDYACFKEHFRIIGTDLS